MAGGLMQLVAYGAQDVYLTGNPQITFFKVVYRRHTNFSMETIEHALNGNPEFGRRSTVTITRNGDLISKVYLMVKLPTITPTVGEGVTSKFAYVRRLGNALVKSVEMEIGGSRIDKQYGTWLNIWYELARSAGSGDRGYLRMVGDVPELTSYNSDEKREYNLYVPLKFWFNRHVGLALPLIALQYHEVRLHFEFTRAQELIVANSDFLSNDVKQVVMQDAIILVDYIYLDSEERRRFAQVGHEYLIEQLQFTSEESVQNSTGKYRLDFNHPTKELVWAMKHGNYTNGKSFICYTHQDDWSSEIDNCTLRLLQDSLALAAAGTPPTNGGTWEEFAKADPVVTETTANGNINVTNESGDDKSLYVNTDSLVVGGYSLTDKIQADIRVTANNELVFTNVQSSLTVRDLSIPVELMVDTRNTRVHDAHVYQFHNFGTLIDGSVNPVEYALLQLNGHDRFDRREGDYFNYVQPDQHHTNTPADGINVYSFALHPEQHQPSGTANLSRIDNTQLSVWFTDKTARTGLPSLNFLNAQNKLYIYAFSYNVLRIMSGMGGLAYSN